MKTNRSFPPPTVTATRALLTAEAPVWIPLRTPFVAICKYVFHPPGLHRDSTGHCEVAPVHGGTLTEVASSLMQAGVDMRRLARSDDSGFRIAQWLKTAGEFVVKNEPIALVDAARARNNSLFKGLDLRDPAILAPESGELVWLDRSDQPHRVFGLIRSTNSLIDANLDHPIDSDLVPFVEAVTGRLLHWSIRWRSNLKLLDRGSRDYLGDLGILNGRKALARTRRNLFSWCHGLWWSTPPANYRAPGWGKATEHERGQLLKVHAGPASAQYDAAWTHTVNALRWEGFDIERMGLGFALSTNASGRSGVSGSDTESLRDFDADFSGLSTERTPDPSNRASRLEMNE